MSIDVQFKSLHLHGKRVATAHRATDGRLRLTPLATAIAYSDGCAISITRTQGVLPTAEAYQDVGFAACFIDW